MIDDVINIALEAGDKIMSWHGKKDIPTKNKTDDSPLTQADQEANDVIINGLKKISTYPILSEESLVNYEIRRQWRTFWLVDPLDGTRNFLANDGQFTVNIALIERGAPIMGVVLAPALELCYSAKRNEGAFLNGEKIYNSSKRTDLIAATSSKHGNDETTEFLKKANITKTIPMGSALKLCKLSEGEIDIYPRLGPTSEWDIAAGHLVAVEGGNSIVDLKTMLSPMYNKKELLNNNFVAYRRDLDILRILGS